MNDAFLARTLLRHCQSITFGITEPNIHEIVRQSILKFRLIFPEDAAQFVVLLDKTSFGHVTRFQDCEHRYFGAVLCINNSEGMRKIGQCPDVSTLRFGPPTVENLVTFSENPLLRAPYSPALLDLYWSIIRFTLSFAEESLQVTS